MKTHKANKDGWTDFVSPQMERYRFACCDCGLTHDMQFQVVKVIENLPNGDWKHSAALASTKYKVQFRVRRNARSTAQIRRHKPNASDVATTPAPQDPH